MTSSATAVPRAWARVPGPVRRLVVNLGTNSVVRSMTRKLTPRSLRILAFHGVDDPAHFEHLLRRILAICTPVNGDDITAWVTVRKPLPRYPVWFTFDDGLKTTFLAAELLASYGIQATCFVNPESIKDQSLLWFQTLDEISRQGKLGPQERERFSTARLKAIPDEARRAEIRELSARLESRELAATTKSGSVDDMIRWREMGHEIGNHTWDHPCLSQCPIDVQRSQITKAHEWLTRKGFSPRFMAYPNGDWTRDASAIATSLGYVASVLFDHRLNHSLGDPQRLSRLRLDADASVSRADSIVSGSHSLLFSAIRR